MEWSQISLGIMSLSVLSLDDTFKKKKKKEPPRPIDDIQGY